MSVLIQPVLVPCLALEHTDERNPLLPVAPFQHRITLDATRGKGTPLPALDIRLGFHLDGLAYHSGTFLDFDKTEKLISQSSPRNIAGIPQGDVDEICAKYWSFLSSGLEGDAFWSSVQSVCGFSECEGKTRWGNYHVHMHEDFVAYSRPPSAEISSPFMTQEDLSQMRHPPRLIGSMDPGKELFVVAWVLKRPPSSHEHLTALCRLNIWLSWLSHTRSWPGFSAPVFASPAP